MNVVLMDGNAADREIIESTSFVFERHRKGPAKFDVLLVSFETARRSTELIASFEGCVRLRRGSQAQGRQLAHHQSRQEIGYTGFSCHGNPIQNNVKELGIISSSTRRSTRAGSTSRRACSTAAAGRWTPSGHGCARCLLPHAPPLKEDVEKIPAKEEIVAWVELTPEQRAYYCMIYEKQMHVLMEEQEQERAAAS